MLLQESFAAVSGVPIIHLLHDGTTRLPESEVDRSVKRGNHCSKLVGRKGMCCKPVRRAFQMDLHLEPALMFTGAPDESSTSKASRQDEGELRAELEGMTIVDLRARADDAEKSHRMDMTSRTVAQGPDAQEAERQNMIAMVMRDEDEHRPDRLFVDEIANWDNRLRLAHNKFGWSDDYERAGMTWRAGAMSTFRINRILHASEENGTPKYRTNCDEGLGLFSIDQSQCEKELKKWYGKDDWRFERFELEFFCAKCDPDKKKPALTGYMLSTLEGVEENLCQVCFSGLPTEERAGYKQIESSRHNAFGTAWAKGAPPPQPPPHPRPAPHCPD